MIASWVFPDPFDSLKPQAPYPISDRFTDRLIQAGITGASWHTLRHTFASRQLREGTDIVTVSRLLGHSVLQTTMRYVHLVKNQLHEAGNRVSVVNFRGSREKAVRTTTTTTTKAEISERGVEV